MNCEKCGAEPGYAGGGGHTFICTLDDRIVCFGCGHDFGPVRELIEKAAKSDFMLAYKATHSIDDVGFFDDAIEYDLRAQVATLTRERDEASKLKNDWAAQAGRIAADLSAARARIAELEKAKDGFQEHSWDMAVRTTLGRIEEYVNTLKDEVTP